MKAGQRLRDLVNSNLKKYRIILWHEDGMSLHSIAKNLDMGRKKVREFIDRFNH
jgi:transposase